MFAMFRFIGGLGVGASTIAAPAFISEIAPPSKRGGLVAMYQLNIVFGILLAFISNYFILKLIPVDSWRWMIGIEAVPALIYTIFVSWVPESPRWLIVKKGDITAAKKIFLMISNKKEVDAEIAMIRASIDNTTTKEPLFQHKYRMLLMLAFGIAFFNQFSGINAILYYAKRIFTQAGLGEDAVLLSTVGIGLANLIFTILGVILIDRLGRKQLMFVGSVGYIITLTATSLAFYNNWVFIIPASLFLFIGVHAIGQGAVIWVFISEIFPNHLRSKGQAFGTSVHWLLAAIIPAFVPLLFASIGPGAVFAIFAGFMTLQLLFVAFLMPETKGVSLEDLQNQLIHQDNELPIQDLKQTIKL